MDIKWMLKQLLPLTYHSHYEADGGKRFAVWRMLFGQCFDIEDVAVAS